MRLKFSALLVVAVIAITACSKQTQTTTTAPESTAAAGAAPQAAVQAPAATGQGKGRVEMTGAIPLTRDFGVTPCSIAKPGKGLLSGYDMTMERGDTIIESGGIHVASYSKDGAYDIGFTKSITEDPLQLNLLSNDKLPKGSTLEQRPDSTIRVTISDGGMKGAATFKNFETLYPTGGRVLGTMTWTCPKIVHFGL